LKNNILFILVVGAIGLAVVPACTTSTQASVASDTGLEYKRRAAIFKSLHIQMTAKYAKDGLLVLPKEAAELKSELQVHSSVDFDKLVFNRAPVRIDKQESRHAIILHDMADLGDGKLRVILFADGHVELASVIRD
jgi:prepilin-type processing-associated H-X9-DG protein